MSLARFARAIPAILIFAAAMAAADLLENMWLRLALASVAGAAFGWMMTGASIVGLKSLTGKRLGHAIVGSLFFGLAFTLSRETQSLWARAALIGVGGAGGFWLWVSDARSGFSCNP